MRTTIRTAVIGGCAAIGLGLLAPAIATAAPAPPGAVSAATDEHDAYDDPEARERLCTERIPRLEERIASLTERVDGGPDVVGSVQNLQMRAEEARAAGEVERAERLDARAERRAGLRLDQLGQAQERLDRLESNQCG